MGLTCARVLCLALLWVAAVLGAEEKHDNVFPLGAIGGTADNQPKESQLKVRTLIEGAPGQYAGLRIGDRIVGVNGSAFGLSEENSANFGRGPLEMLGSALDAAEGGDGKLKLQVLRDGKKTDIEVNVPRLGAYGPKYPFDCPKSRALYDELCKRMAADQGRDGGWAGGEVTSAYSALALLARRDGKYMANVKRWAHHLAETHKSGDSFPKGGCSNWGIAFDGIFLGEYYWATKDEKVLPTLQVIVDELASRQAPTGLYYHGTDACYGGNGLSIVGSAVLWCWSMAGKCGVKVPADRFEKLVAYLRTSSGKSKPVEWPNMPGAAVSPSDTPAAKNLPESFMGYNHTCIDIGQSIARTSHTVLALIISGTDKNWAEQMGRHLTSHTFYTLECHAVACMGMANTCPAQLLSNPAGYRRHMDAWKWYFALARNPDGSVGYIGSRGNIGGDSYLNYDNIMTATVALSLGAAEQNLYMHGKFLDIPGLATGTLSKPLQAAYDEMIAKRFSSGLIARLQGAAKGQNADAAPAAQMLEFINRSVLQPELSAAQKAFDLGDCYDAERKLQKLKENFGAYAVQLPDAVTLREKIQAPALAPVLAVGREYYKLVDDLERAQKPQSLQYGGISSAARVQAALKELAEKDKNGYYGKRAAELLKRLIHVELRG